MQWLTRVGLPDLNGLIEIVCLAFVFYYIFFFFRGTRMMPVLIGFVIVFIMLFMLTSFLHLDTLNWVFGRFSVYLAVAFLIIFQPEIRWALGELGKRQIFGGAASEKNTVESIVQAVSLLMKRHVGALIAVERRIGTRTIQETGVMLDSLVSPELLAGIFFPYAPLHDGGVIIAGNRIAAARCMFPLTQRHELDKRAVGTRHRAAIGLSDETDAVVVVLSEETGMVSVGHKGRLIQDLSLVELRQLLSELLEQTADNGQGRNWTQQTLGLFALKTNGKR